MADVTGAARHNRVRDLAEAGDDDAIEAEFGEQQRDVVTYERILRTSYSNERLQNARDVSEYELRMAMATKPSGLQWKMRAHDRWVACVKGNWCGSVVRISASIWAARQYLSELDPDEGINYFPVARTFRHGTLATCANALVDAVTGGRNAP